MKKYLSLIMVAVLCACGGYIKNENGSERLKQLSYVPESCDFLFSVQTNASVYDQDDARRYLENTIAERTSEGNVYYLAKNEAKKNDGAIFGPKYTYHMGAKVYKCPNPESL